jgi:hypothetical protein
MQWLLAHRLIDWRACRIGDIKARRYAVGAVRRGEIMPRQLTPETRRASLQARQARADKRAAKLAPIIAELRAAEGRSNVPPRHALQSPSHHWQFPVPGYPCFHSPR